MTNDLNISLAKAEKKLADFKAAYPILKKTASEIFEKNGRKNNDETLAAFEAVRRCFVSIFRAQRVVTRISNKLSAK